MVAEVRRGERKIVELLAPGTAFYSAGERPGGSQGREGLASPAPHLYCRKMSASMNNDESRVLEQEEKASRTLRPARAGV